MKQYKVVIKPTQTNWADLFQFVDPFVTKLDHKRQVKVSLFSAVIAFPYLVGNKAIIQAAKCIELSKDWLANKLVDKEELKKQSILVYFGRDCLYFSSGNTANAICEDKSYATAAICYNFYFANREFFDFVEQSKLSFLYLDALCVEKGHIEKDHTISNFCEHDIDELDQTDCKVLVDYIQEKQEIDLTPLAVHPRILFDFVRNQVGMLK